MKMCPFRKQIIYSSRQNSGAGYPLDWVTKKKKKKCIGDKCAAYQIVDNCYPDKKFAYCELCGKQDINVET